MAGERLYNDPAGGNQSTIGDKQFNEHYWQRRALQEAARSQVFQPMASSVGMPKHMGKKITRYHYLPLLDDQNVNSQGLDAAGATIANGNLYGSSKDIGTIPGKMPTLTETGGRVNRVGFRRKQIEGTFEKFGFFDEYTKDSVDFDTDPDLLQHVNREMIHGSSEITEDLLQIDLLSNAGVKRYPGTATSIATVDATTVTYKDLLQLHIDLNQNRTPRKTTMMTGTRMIDTRTVAAGRLMFIGSELQPLFEEMVDTHGNPAFVPVHQYAGNGDTVEGEIGKVGYFRLVVVEEMMNWTGAGADATGNTTHYQTGGSFDVFPMLVIGDGSFTTIGFKTEGSNVKFDITHVKPGKESADRFDPYGETGFMSIKWWYGFMLLRPERLALFYTAAKL